MAELIPFALKDAPTLIEAVYPAQKISFEAQKERKAGPGQTLTSLGSYWKGRKPLILVRSVVLGTLLPQTSDTEKDLEIYELLMAFDDESLAKRALMLNAIKPKEIAERVSLRNPWEYFTHNVKAGNERFTEVEALTFPISPDELGLKIQWRRDIKEQNKLNLLRVYLAQLDGYEEKSLLCKRPEEVAQDWLSSHVWPKVNQHYQDYGIKVTNYRDLIEQLGILRFGRKPIVGDTFSGGGSIPFEAARLGCDVYASDLNPIACLLTWSALNVIGASEDEIENIYKVQKEVADEVDKQITSLGIEHDSQGNRAKAYLYCLEARCPETGWMIPLSPSWVISKSRKVVAQLVPDHSKRRFDIQVKSGVSDEEMSLAETGTFQKGEMVYSLLNKQYRTTIKTLRGDFKDDNRSISNRLRRWDKEDFKPRAEDIFQERLYAVHWITKDCELTAA